MKYLSGLVLSVALASQAVAGGLAPVVIEEPIVVVEDTSSSMSAWLIPLLILAILVAIGSQNSCRKPANTNSQVDCRRF